MSALSTGNIWSNASNPGLERKEEDEDMIATHTNWFEHAANRIQEPSGGKNVFVISDPTDAVRVKLLIWRISGPANQVSESPYKLAIDVIKNALGLSLTNLGEVLGVSRQAIYDWISGVTPRDTVLTRLNALSELASLWTGYTDQTALTVFRKRTIQGKAFLKYLKGLDNPQKGFLLLQSIHNAQPIADTAISNELSAFFAANRKVDGKRSSGKVANRMTGFPRGSNGQK